MAFSRRIMKRHAAPSRLGIHSEGIPPDYRWHRIIDVAKPLRDGVYDLETHGEKFKVRRAKGFWLTAYPVIGV